MMHKIRLKNRFLSNFHFFITSTWLQCENKKCLNYEGGVCFALLCLCIVLSRKIFVYVKTQKSQSFVEWRFFLQETYFSLWHLIACKCLFNCLLSFTQMFILTPKRYQHRHLIHRPRMLCQPAERGTRF
jgi:hypothetical protein